MRVALAAGLDAGLAADAAVGVDEEVQVGGFHREGLYENRQTTFRSERTFWIPDQ